MTPYQITGHLRLAPTQVFRTGERMSARNPTSHVRDEALWLLESGLDSDEPIDRHFVALLEELEPRREELRALAADASLDFFAGFSSGSGQGGAVIASAVLARLAQIPGARA